MSTIDPRRDAQDGRADQPATAVATDASPNANDSTPANRSTAVESGADSTAVADGDRGRHSAPAGPAGPDGPIQDSGVQNRELGDGDGDVHDSARRAALDEDRDPNRTRVLPATEQPPRVDDRRTGDDRATADAPTVAAPTVAAPPAGRAAEADRRLDPRSVLAREKEEFGGMRFLLAFFGWLTATGLAVILGAIAGGILAAVGSSNGSANSTTGLQSLGIAGAIVTAVILFVAYYAGGYVAGRMARFSGAAQGVAVWLWAIIITVLAAIAGAIGSQFGLFSQVGSVAQVPINGQTLTLAGIVGVVAALALSLVGAVLGGIAGMRFHRRVDRSAFGA
jgi:hypothetical protein